MKGKNWLSISFIVLLFACDTLDDREEIANTSEIATTLSIGFDIDKYANLKTATRIRFENLSSEGATYEWTFGDGNTSTERNPVHTYNEPGFYSVQLRVKSNSSTETFSKDIRIADINATFSLVYFNPEEQTFYRGSLLEDNFTPMFSAPYNPMAAFAVDEKNALIYYFDYYNLRILRNTLSGGKEEIVIENVEDVRTMEFDQENRKLYFAEYSYNTISAYDVTTNQTSIILQPQGNSRFGNIQDMELKDGKIYGITPVQGRESIYEGNLINQNAELIINYEQGGHGYGLAVDNRNEKIYFNSVEAAAVQVADKDGSSISQLAKLDKVRVYGMFMDEIHNQLIWTTWSNTLHIYDFATDRESIFNIEGANRKIKLVELDKR